MLLTLWFTKKAVTSILFFCSFMGKLWLWSSSLIASWSSWWINIRLQALFKSKLLRLVVEHHWSGIECQLNSFIYIWIFILLWNFPKQPIQKNCKYLLLWRQLYNRKRNYLLVNFFFGENPPCVHVEVVHLSIKFENEDKIFPQHSC